MRIWDRFGLRRHHGQSISKFDREADNSDIEALIAFAKSRTGVEFFVEPETFATDTTAGPSPPTVNGPGAALDRRRSSARWRAISNCPSMTCRSWDTRTGCAHGMPATRTATGSDSYPQGPKRNLHSLCDAHDISHMNSGSEPLVIRTPQDVISAIPYLLGFHPTDSLVAVGCGGPRGTCAMRFDLPHGGQAAPAGEHLASVLAHNGFTIVLLAGYGPGAVVTPVMDAVRRALAGRRIEVREALRVEGSRALVLSVRRPRLLPTGRHLRRDRRGRRPSGRRRHGRAHRPGFAEATVAPLGGPVRIDAQGHPLGRGPGLRSGRRGPSAGPGHGGPHRQGDPPPSDREIAMLGIVLTSLRVRDEAWVRIDPDRLEPHLAFWREILVRVEPRYVPAPACLMAYTAYISGNGGPRQRRARPRRPGRPRLHDDRPHPARGRHRPPPLRSEDQNYPEASTSPTATPPDLWPCPPTAGGLVNTHLQQVLILMRPSEPEQR